MTFLDDGQAALLSADGIAVYDVASGGRGRRPRSARSSGRRRRPSLGGYPDFMSKEIHEQPHVLRRIAARAARRRRSAWPT